MKKIQLILSIVFLSMLLAFSTTFQASAQQAKKISLQGFLKDANGKAVPDAKNFPVTFKLYTTLSGGTAAWTEDQNVDVSGGVYSVQLGKNISLGSLSWGNSTYYVGVTIGDAELIPRTELTFAPYSLGSPTANTVICSGALGDVKYSILNPTQFALQNGDCWVPMDGGSMANSKLAAIIGDSNVPNAGGLFLRGQESANGTTNYDPERTATSLIAQVQVGSFEDHTHTGSVSASGSHSHTFFDATPTFTAYQVQGMGTGDNIRRNTETPATPLKDTSTNGFHSHTLTIGSSGGRETRPSNLNLWTYIRIN